MALGDSHDLDRFFKEHGIAPEVGRGRYDPWTMEAPEKVYDAWPDEQNRGFARRKIATKSDGLIIRRFPPPGLGLPPVYAELRPDEDIVIDEHNHWHGERPPNADERKRLKRKWIHKPGDMQRHIKKHHGGKNINHVHTVETRTHYVFPKGAHAKRVDAHPISHDAFHDAERVFFAIEGCIKADAIVSELLEIGEPPAVVSVPSVTLWLATGQARETWNVSELDLVAKRLLSGKVAVIVPDADWINNWMVYRQAMLLRSFLRERGVDARVAAPDIKAFRRNKGLKGFDDSRVAHLRGEFPGGEGAIAELIEIDRPVRVDVPLLVKHRWAGRSHRIDRYGARILETLAIHAGIEVREDNKTPEFTDDGKLRMSLETLGRVMRGIGARTAQRTIADLCEKTDALTKVAGSHEVCGGDWWHRGREVAPGDLTKEEVLALHPRWEPKELYRAPYRYVEQPIYVLHEDLRAGKPTERRLGRGVEHRQPRSLGETDIKMTKTDEIERLLHQGFKADDIQRFSGSSLDVVAKISADAGLNDEIVLEVGGAPVSAVVASPQKPIRLSFHAERGQRLVVVVTDRDAHNRVIVHVFGPTNRQPRAPLCTTEAEPESTTVCTFTTRNRGKHRVEVLPADRRIEVDFAESGPKPAPVYVGFAPIVVALNSAD